MEDLGFMTLVETQKKVVNYYERDFAVKDAIALINEHAKGDIIGLKYIEPIELNSKGADFKKAYLKCMNGGDIIVVNIDVLEIPTNEPTKYELTYKRYIIDDSKLQPMARRKQ